MERIIESTTGKDLTPHLLEGELERRIGLLYNDLNICDRASLAGFKYMHHKFSELPQEKKSKIINLLT